MRNFHRLFSVTVITAVLLGHISPALAQQQWVIKDELTSKSPVVKSEAFPAYINLAFDLPDIAKDQQVRLGLDVRIAEPGPDIAGPNPWMNVTINGTSICAPSLLNKSNEFFLNGGSDALWEAASTWRVSVAPDFSDEIYKRPTETGVPDRTDDAFHYLWDITSCAKTGKNTLTIIHQPIFAQGSTMVFHNIFVEIGSPLTPPAGNIVTLAPLGPLPTFIADNQPLPVKMDVRLGDHGAIGLCLAGRKFTVASRTSEPNGNWITMPSERMASVFLGKSAVARWAGTGYSVTRKMTVHSDHIQVADTITNTTNKLIGVICENCLAFDHDPCRILLCGRPPYGTHVAREPRHPSVTATWKDLTLGLVADNDLFRAHIKADIDKKSMMLADPELGIPPRGSHSLEWSIYPAPNGDYWDFVNAVRRNWGSNLTLPSLVFYPGDANGVYSSQNAQYYGDWVHKRKVDFICSFNSEAVGTATVMNTKWCDDVRAWRQKLLATAPRTKVLVYMHPETCTEPNAKTKYADSLHLDANGICCVSPYKYPIYLCIPTLENSYGKALMETIKYIVNDMKADGLFMDEMEVGGSVPPYAYGGQWDGCTAIINPDTHALTGKCSNTALLTLPWKAAMIRYLREHGKTIVGNTSQATRTMLDLDVLRFAEISSSFSVLIEGQLGTCWGLGNYDMEQSDRARAKMARRCLDYGGVLAMYVWADTPPDAHFYSLMYPITPIKIQAGMVLGKERIITNRSGRYGWPDDSTADVYVIDAAGKCVKKPLVKEITDRGHRLYEVRMPSDSFAIIVRKQTERGSHGL